MSITELAIEFVHLAALVLLRVGQKNPIGCGAFQIQDEMLDTFHCLFGGAARE